MPDFKHEARRNEIGEDKTIALDHHAATDGKRRLEHRAAIRERMKFTMLAAWIDGRGKIAQECRVEFAAGERRWQQPRIDACDARCQAAGDHLACELTRIAPPNREDRPTFLAPQFPPPPTPDLLRNKTT